MEAVGATVADSIINPPEAAPTPQERDVRQARLTALGPALEQAAAELRGANDQLDRTDAICTPGSPPATVPSITLPR
jgi:hypothetical protein